MRKVNSNEMAELSWSSPKGKFVGFGKQVSEELGRKPKSTDLNERHPFDVEVCRIPPGQKPYPYHLHSAQWEFYHVISGSGLVRHQDGTTAIAAGDAFIFKPGEPHQLINDGQEDLILYVVADNPTGESFYYPESPRRNGGLCAQRVGLFRWRGIGGARFGFGRPFSRQGSLAHSWNAAWGGEVLEVMPAVSRNQIARSTLGAMLITLTSPSFRATWTNRIPSGRG